MFAEPLGLLFLIDLRQADPFFLRFFALSQKLQRIAGVGDQVRGDLLEELNIRRRDALQVGL